MEIAHWPRETWEGNQDPRSVPSITSMSLTQKWSRRTETAERRTKSKKSIATREISSFPSMFVACGVEIKIECALSATGRPRFSLTVWHRVLDVSAAGTLKDK